MFNYPIVFSAPTPLKEIRLFQREKNIILPSDYVFLLLNYNEFNLANDKFGIILSEDNQAISGLHLPISSLDSFKLSYNHKEGYEDFYHGDVSEYFCIASLLYQGALLIGHTPENQNKIYLDLPTEYDEVQFLADNFFEFINDEILLR